MQNSHRLFIYLAKTDDQDQKNLVKQDMRWAYTMDIAIANAVLAMRYGLDEDNTVFLHTKFHRLLPKENEPECLLRTALLHYCQHSPEIEKPWDVQDICDFILALTHRNYAVQYEWDKWMASKFKAIPVGLPRTRNRTPKARNYTSHRHSMYQGYTERLRIGKVFEIPTMLELHDGVWLRKASDEKQIELTETRNDNWLHTRLNELPRIWNHINNLLKTSIQLENQLYTEEKLKNILGIVAQIHWWISHGMPYRRGSAAIGDMLSKTVLEYHQISTPCWKIGVAPDLEAFCSSLDEFIENYVSLFVKPPIFLVSTQ